jgi:hypothetical protein
MANCPWDGWRVADEGDTCDLECYASWLTAKRMDALILLADDETPPKSLQKQPWYLADYHEDARPYQAD